MIKHIISVDLVDKTRRFEDIPEGWTDDASKKHITRYEKFLKLIQKYSNQRFAPARNIDKMWHQSMLSPVAYCNDRQGRCWHSCKSVSNGGV